MAAALEGVIAQQLAKTRDGTFRPAVEVFRGGLNSTKPIVEGRIKDLNFFIESRQGGMQSLDQHLLELHLAGLISGTETMRLANNPEAVGVGLRAARQASAASSTTGSTLPLPTPLIPSRVSHHKQNVAITSETAHDLGKKPRPAFGLVDPVLDQARRGDVVVLVAHLMGGPQRTASSADCRREARSASPWE